MKKFLLSTLILVACVNFSFAQSNSGSSFFEDTLLWLPGTNNMYVNPTDSGNFQIMSFDVDSLTTDPSIAFTLPGNAIDEYESFQALDIDPAQGDVTSGFHWAGISFFSPPGVADNWLTFGPITIPNAGVDIRWIFRYPSGQPNFQDGYEFYVDTVGLNPGDFSGPPLFSVPDNSPTTTSAIGVWRNAPMQNLDGPTWRGKEVYFAFHHNASNKLVLYLDNIRIQEAFNTGVDELSNDVFEVAQASPNPFENFTTIDLTVKKNIDNLNVLVYDLQGRKIMTQELQNISAGEFSVELDGSDWDAGTYYYRIEGNGAVISGKVLKM